MAPPTLVRGPAYSHVAQDKPRKFVTTTATGARGRTLTDYIRCGKIAKHILRSRWTLRQLLTIQSRKSVSRKNLPLAVITVAVLASLIFAVLFLRNDARSRAENDNQPTAIPAKLEKVLFSGDSISDGWYASVKSKGFVYIVQRAIHPTQSVHTHMHGYTVGQIAEKFVIPTDVDLAIVELGTNDVNKGTTYESFNINYPAYIERVMTKSPKAALICVGVFPHSREARNFDKVIHDACERHHGHFISISDLSSNPRAMGPVGKQTWAGKANLGHPNDYGHALIARRILNIMQDRAK